MQHRPMGTPRIFQLRVLAPVLAIGALAVTVLILLDRAATTNGEPPLAEATPVLLAGPTPTPTAVPRATPTPPAAAPTPTAVPRATPTPAPQPTPTSVVTLLPASPLKPSIAFAEPHWASARTQTAIVRYIVEHGLGHGTTLKSFGSYGGASASLLNGESDVLLETLPHRDELALASAMGSGMLFSLGTSVEDYLPSSFIIPNYLAEEYPELRNVRDLKDHWQLFSSDGGDSRGQLISCPLGFSCETTVRQHVEAYDLSEFIEPDVPASASAAERKIVSAFRAHQPVLFYHSWPSTLLTSLEAYGGTYSLVTPLGPDCTPHCGFEPTESLIVGRLDLINDAVGVTDFLAKWRFPADAELTTRRLTDRGASYERTAIWWLCNDKSWRAYLPVDAGEAVEASLIGRCTIDPLSTALGQLWGTTDWDLAPEVAGLIRAARQEGEVSYYSHSAAEAEAGCAGFERMFPAIDCVPVGLGTQALSAQFIQERADGVQTADVLSSSMALLSTIQTQGYLERIDWASAYGVDQSRCLLQGNYCVRAQAMYSHWYNTDAVGNDELPASFDDFLDPKWKGRLVANNFLYYAGMGMWCAVIGLDECLALAERLERDQELLITADQTEQILTGSRDICFLCFGAPVAERDVEGLSVDWFVTDNLPVVQFIMGVTDMARHPNAARLLVLWAMSPQGSLAYATANEYKCVCRSAWPGYGDAPWPLDQDDFAGFTPIIQSTGAQTLDDVLTPPYYDFRDLATGGAEFRNARLANP